MSSIVMVDPLACHAEIQQELERAASRVIRSGRYILGPEVSQFEVEISEYLGARHAVSCASGTDALILALTAAGVGFGDEVITTPFTFFATAEAILRIGATPVFVDIEPETFNLNPCLLVAAYTEKTKAVLVVHLFGLPARIMEIKAFCLEKNLILIEDCAQSFGAEISGVKTGCFGDLGCFSFFPSKNLGGFGDAGLVITNNNKYRDTVKQLRNHGSSRHCIHQESGFNSRMDEMQAALLRIKLKYIDIYNRQRIDIACRYSQSLNDCELLLPSGNNHVFHQYTVQADYRDLLQRELRKEEIASVIYYSKPLHHQPVFRNKAFCRLAEDLFVADTVSKICLSLPVYPGMSIEQCQRVISAVKRAFARTLQG